MLVKNVINGMYSQYKFEELHIISSVYDRVLFSGTMESWKNVDEDMIAYKKDIEGKEVLNKILFNKRKLFLFI